jgi:hypothetical protein
MAPRAANDGAPPNQVDRRGDHRCRLPGILEEGLGTGMSAQLRSRGP